MNEQTESSELFLSPAAECELPQTDKITGTEPSPSLRRCHLAVHCCYVTAKPWLWSLCSSDSVPFPNDHHSRGNENAREWKRAVIPQNKVRVVSEDELKVVRSSHADTGRIYQPFISECFHTECLVPQIISKKSFFF